MDINIEITATTVSIVAGDIIILNNLFTKYLLNKKENMLCLH